MSLPQWAKGPSFLSSTAAYVTVCHVHSVYMSEKITSVLKEISVKTSAWQKYREPGALVD